MQAYSSPALRLYIQEWRKITASFSSLSFFWEAKGVFFFLLGNHFCTCWMSCGAGQSDWNSRASWVHDNTIKESLSPKSRVISVFHWPINVHILHLSYDFV